MIDPSKYTNEPEANARVEQVQRRLRFLSEISHHLASSLDLDVTIKTVSELAVPYLADWCIVARANQADTNESLVGWRIVAATHIDQMKARLAQSVAQQALTVAMGADGVLPHVAALIQMGQSVVLRMTSEEALRAIAPSEILQGGILALGAATIIIVPLRTHAETIGAMVLGSADPNRSYDAIDLSLTEDIARRAALAIENANLYRQAQEAVQQRDAFLSIVSHDLKNSLVLIGGYAQVLQRQIPEDIVLRERLDAQLSLIRSTVSTMTTQLEQLLEVPMLASGKKDPLDREPVDLVELVNQIVADYVATTKLHRIHCTAQPDTIIGLWDRSRLDRVFNNLLANAIKYSPRGGDVTIHITSEDAEDGPIAIVSVADQGVGIPAYDLPRIFDMFHRASNVRTRFRGTGLGLPSVRSIVEQHGGRVDVSSTEGVGSIFVVRLPTR